MSRLSLFDSVTKRIVERAWYRGSAGLKRDLAAQVMRGYEPIAYERLRDNGLAPAGIIDVGANRGDWSRNARAIFGPLPLLMIEAQEGLRGELEAAGRELGGAAVEIALLGATRGETRTFYEMGTGSSLLPEASNVGRIERTLTTVTLDELAARHLPGLAPLFLKLDVQGAELMILAGGEATLRRCEAVQLEAALLPYNAGAPLLAEVVAFMAERGFLATELAGFSRPGDHLVQVDVVFVREGSPLRPDRFAF